MKISHSETPVRDIYPGSHRIPAIEVKPVDRGAIINVHLPGVRESDIDLSVDHDHLILDGQCRDHHPDYHLDLELVSGTSGSDIQAVIHDGEVSVMVPNPDNQPGCQLRTAA